MAEHDYNEGELPLMSAGRKLRETREAAGLSIDDISARTKIAVRHLEAIEQDRFSDLASRTYAIGFARTYARAVGLNDTAITDIVRRQLESEGDVRTVSQPDNFEPGDPARVPSSSLAWLAGVGAVALLVLLFIFWRSFINPTGTLPDLTEEKPVVAADATPTSVADNAAETVAANAPVVLTADANVVWVKVTDGAGNQLFQKEMAMGETYTVPADASGPLLTTARPDALRISVGGKVLPFLSNVPSVMRNVPVDAQSLVRSGAANAPAVGESIIARPPAMAQPAPSPMPVASRPMAAEPSPPPASATPTSEVETSTVSE